MSLFMHRLVYSVGAFLCLACLAPAHAQVPGWQLRWDGGLFQLAPLVRPAVEPADTAPDPDRWWQAAQALNPSATATAEGQTSTTWPVRAGVRTIGALRLLAGPTRRTYVVQVPVVRVDQVQVFWRVPGQPWNQARAGDRVALSQWPFKGQYPAFPLDFDGQPLDILVSIENNGSLQAPLWLMPDPVYRERRLLQANLSGMVGGMFFMAVVVCAISAFVQRRRASWLLVAYGVVAWMALVTSNGFAALWFTPDWPLLNDAGKHFLGVLTAGLLTAAVVSAQDKRYHLPWQRHLPAAAVGAALLVGFLQAALLPADWRIASYLGFTALCVATLFALSAQIRLRGGYPTGWGLRGVLLFAAAVGVNLLPRAFGYAIDLQAASAALLMAASLLMLRHGLFLQHQQGRQVLGREALLASRDPLTALLSHAGLQEKFDEHVLLQQASNVPSWVVMFELRAIQATHTEDGVVTGEKLLVRMAAILQRELGEHWQVARVGFKYFAALSSEPYSPDQVRTTGAAVIAAALRYTHPPGWLELVDLRMAATQRQFESTQLKALLGELSQATAALQGNKRIAVL